MVNGLELEGVKVTVLLCFEICSKSKLFVSSSVIAVGTIIILGRERTSYLFYGDEEGIQRHRDVSCVYAEC